MKTRISKTSRFKKKMKIVNTKYKKIKLRKKLYASSAWKILLLYVEKSFQLNVHLIFTLPSPR